MKIRIEHKFFILNSIQKNGAVMDFSEINEPYRILLTELLKECIESGIDSIFSSYCMQYGVMEIDDFADLIEGVGLLDFLLVCNFVINMSEREFSYKTIFDNNNNKVDQYIEFDDKKLNPQKFQSAMCFIASVKYHWHPTNAPKECKKEYQKIFDLACHCEKLLFEQHVVDGYIEEFRNS